MNAAQVHHPNYYAVWYWLLGLAIGSVLISRSPLPHRFVIVLIFAAAAVKAGLVVWYFMHLKFERLLIYMLIVTPLIAFAILLLVLFPEIASR
jgi:cytochrome c oxidase subunit 4